MKQLSKKETHNKFVTTILKIGKTNTFKSTIIGMYQFPVPELLKEKKEK